MIRKLVLKNWKSHEETVVNFDRGTNLLIGIMGSGKSSLLEAMCFALFGTFPAVFRRRIKISDVIMNRPSVKNSASVELEFELDGEIYSVKRTIYRRGNAEAELRKNGALVMADPGKVTGEIERLLKLDYDLFYRAIYSEQNRIDYFLMLGPRDRKTQIDELLGIDRFEVARANASTVINSLRRLKIERENELAGIDEEGISKALAGLKNEAETLEKEKKNVLAALEAAKSERNEAEKAFASLEAMKKKWDSLQQRKSGLEYALKKMEEEIKLKETGESIGNAAELEAIVTSLEGELTQKSNALSELKRKEGSVRQALSALEVERRTKAQLESMLSTIPGGAEGAEARVEELSKKRDELVKALAESKAREKEIRTLIEELSSAEGKCPVCERQMDEKLRLRLLESRKMELEALLRQMNNWTSERTNVEKMLAEAKRIAEHAGFAAKRLKEFEGLEEKLAGANQTLEMVAGEIAVASKTLHETETRLTDARRRLQRAKEIESLEARIASAKSELGEISAAIATLSFDEDGYDTVRRRFDEARERFVRLEGEYRLFEEKVANVRMRCHELEDQLKRCAEKKESVKRLGATIDGMLVLQSALVETQAALREELIEAINTTMAELWPIIYPYGDYDGVALRAGEDDYSLELHTNEAWIPVDGFASGGERACACIALRIAFAMAIVPNLRWLVLDEPTHNLDEQGIRALVDVLHERIPEIVEQVFVITHDENLKEAASARLYRFERNKEVGEPTRVIEMRS